MEVFSDGHVSEVISMRLDQGEDVLAAIEAVAKDKDVHTGVVISGIGTLDRARLHYITHTGYPPKDEFVEYEGPIELLSMDGIVAEHIPHIHTCISIKDKTYAGHLEPGCRVLYLAEIAIARLEGVRLRRRPHSETGVNQLQSAE
ncbi:MAG: DNA-binding protein [Armatimonadota bacterium]|nr:MAG: DNA-binding protein [Armatimonadota bacterium]